MRALEVRDGRTTTVQDGGRLGYARIGVPRSGPMDATSHRIAALLAGAAPTDVGDTAVLEVGPGGASLTAVEGTVLLAIVSPDARCTDDAGRTDAVTAGVRAVTAGATLQLAPGDDAQWVYVAPVGGFRLEPVLGSRSQHPRSGLGPPRSEPWVLPLGEPPEAAVPALGDRGWRHPGVGPLGLLPAPQSHLFAAEVRELLVTAVHRTTGRFDRMGHRLDGPPLPAMSGHDIVSDGVVLGALQVPGDGRVFVLSADHQTTGGYPKIAVLCRADLDRFVQLPPGRAVRFEWVDVETATQRRSAVDAAVGRLLAGPSRPDTSTLASANLITGVTEG